MRNKLPSVTDYVPPYETPEKDPFRDPELGLPEIHKVQGSQEKDKATSYMRENAMQSLGLTDKIDMALGAFDYGSATGDEVHCALTEMMRVAASDTRFNSPEEFADYLTEGILLNVNRLISRAINIPQGEYMVYSIGPKKAMLIPTTELSVQETDFTSSPRVFEIHTGHLLGCWDKAERLLAERAPPPQFAPERAQRTGRNLERRGKRRKIQDVTKGSYGNMKYPRDADFRSEREAHDLSLDDIVSRLGGDVDKSTVSRWGAQGGTPSSRMPSGEHMIKLDKIGIDPNTFADKIGKKGASGVPTKGGGQVSGG